MMTINVDDWVTYDDNGNMHIKIPRSVKLTGEIGEAITQYIQDKVPPEDCDGIYLYNRDKTNLGKSHYLIDIKE